MYICTYLYSVVGRTHSTWHGPPDTSPSHYFSVEIRFAVYGELWVHATSRLLPDTIVEIVTRRLDHSHLSNHFRQNFLIRSFYLLRVSHPRQIQPGTKPSSTPSCRGNHGNQVRRLRTFPSCGSMFLCFPVSIIWLLWLHILRPRSGTIYGKRVA